MSSATDLALQDSDARLLQQMMAKIERLEEQSVGIPPGLLLPFTGLARSPHYSDSHLAAIGAHWTHHIQLNDINEEAIAYDRNTTTPRNGIIKADSAAAMPSQGQPGGLASDGSYSYYFPGTGKCRVELPLLSELTGNFFFECLVKPEVASQLADIFYNGVVGTNGWGVGMSNAAGTAAGNLLTSRTSGGGVYNTGLEFTANYWHWIGIAFTGTSYEIAMVKIDPISKTITTGGNAPTVSSVVKPTTGSYIGNGGSTITRPFKGWIDEVLVYDGTIPIASEPEQWTDRWITAIEPSAPPGFVVPDGTIVSRAKYDSLFKTIGTMFGAGDGVSTFALPNLSGRVIVGKGAPPNLAESGNGAAPYGLAIGQIGGEQYHVLSLAELAQHSHIFYGVAGSGPYAGTQVVGTEALYGLDGSGGNPGVQYAGSNWGHNNMPPYLSANYLLKT